MSLPQIRLPSTRIVQSMWSTWGSCVGEKDVDSKEAQGPHHQMAAACRASTKLLFDIICSETLDSQSLLTCNDNL